jgi:hypothetical protein
MSENKAIEKTDFLSLAAQCFQLADNAPTPSDRTTLLTMAQAWLDLAIEEEQISKVIREADVSFEVRTSDTMRGAPLWAMDLSAPPAS